VRRRVAYRKASVARGFVDRAAALVEEMASFWPEGPSAV